MAGKADRASKKGCQQKWILIQSHFDATDMKVRAQPDQSYRGFGLLFTCDNSATAEFTLRSSFLVVSRGVYNVCLTVTSLFKKTFEFIEPLLPTRPSVHDR